MTNQLTKLDVARHQLGTAMDLFIRDRDPVAVQCLACGGAEMIEAVAELQKVEMFSTHNRLEVMDTRVQSETSLASYLGDGRDSRSN